jgi:serine/threonine-protein kinase HipA
MSIHFVGENLDKARGHYRAGTGALIQLVRGIYADADDDVEATVLKHAVRIAKYLYPKTYLSAASAIALAPTRDGRLFLSGRRKQRTRIRGLEIIQNEAPAHPSLGSAVIDDGMGEFRVDVSSLRQRFLESLRLRSEHAASIDDAARRAIAARLIEEYGGEEAAADAVWVLARENGWLREGERAERFLKMKPLTTPVRNLAALDLIVAWHGEPIGHLTHDGFEWRWAANERKIPPLIRQTTPGKLPPFITSLLPEGWLESVLKDKDERATLRSGRRYMSNITIAETEAELAALPRDVLRSRLADRTKDGVFTGAYAGPGHGELNETFERNLARIFESNETPRLSGIQIKAPMNLDAEGVLSPSMTTPFTHILKPSVTGGFEALPVIEWLSLSLGGACGFVAPAIALVSMPDGLHPALIVERFDIRVGDGDLRMLALEDMASVLDLPSSSKYDSTIERAARALRPISTSPDEDLTLLLKRALFAWLIADGDMHLKNMAVLKIAQPGADMFQSVRMAPLYDAVTTRVFPTLKQDRMALKLAGKDDQLRRKDFKTLARTIGLSAAEGDAAIDDVLTKLDKAANAIAVPGLVRSFAATGKMVDDVLQLVRDRLSAFK